MGIALLAFTLSARAQYGTMTLNPDSRSMAMGGTTVTNISSSQTIFNNPSLVSFANAPFQIATSYYGNDGGDYYALSAYFQFLTGGAIQAGWRNFDYDSGRDMSFELCYSRPIARIFSIAIAGRYINYCNDLDQTSNALVADLSASCRIPLSLKSKGSNVLIGAKLTNLGGYLSGPSNAELPIDLIVGAGFDLKLHESHRLFLSADVGYRFNPDVLKGTSLSLGAEYELMELLSVRGGYHFGEGKGYNIDYASAGIGLHFLFFRIDAAYLFAPKKSLLHNTYSVSLGLNF